MSDQEMRVYRHSQDLRNRAVGLYLDGFSSTKVSRTLGVTQQSVCRWVRQAGFEMRPRKEATEEIRDRARKMYQDGMSSEQIAAEVGFTSESVCLWLHKAGIKMRGNHGNKAPDEIRERAVQLYEDGQSVYSIAREIGYSSTAIRTWAKAAGLKMRPQPCQFRKKDDPTSPWAEGNDW